MAQKREREETELKVPESLPLCTPPIPTKLSGADRSQEPADPKLGGSVDSRSSTARSPDRLDLALVSTLEAEAKRREVNRCSGCKRKVGLMGFRCRCGDMFCSEHRYSDRHDCSFDYKAAGREAIARENPLVRAAKILKV
ncbi:hypothetical protein RJ639_021600 [Escallonia herrerae]|uniref:AN1-type domain-containing protein n=1 Tax=Escallonia herrerae TaxID=1293975 RepID=A0AA88V4F3_9ASTE|nr:hypothetical protein RJ639_021600 [Escallonia herrerae]